MAERIVVINPNSTTAVTDAMDEAVDRFRFQGGPEIECMTLEGAPPGLECQRDLDSVVMPLSHLVEREDNSASAFVVACFSDPGVPLLREITKRPVFGICEAGLTSAMNLGERIGVISILPGAVRRHGRIARAHGIESRFAGSIPINMGVVELEQGEKVMARMTEVGTRLRDERGADVVVMGCAGMARYRDELQDTLGLPVVEPTQAGVGMALTAVQAGYRRKAA
jgi:Asp/Glu/hydantoin racemase